MLEQLKRPFRYPKYTLEDNKDQPVSGGLSKVQRAKNLRGTLARIFRYLTGHRGKLAAVLLMVLISSAMMLAGPLIVGRAIDIHIVDGKSGIGLTLLMLAVAYVIHSLSIWLQNIWMIEIAQKTVRRMRAQLFSRLHLLPIRFFDKRKHGELMSRVANDIENVSSTLNSSFIQIVTSVLALTGILTVMIIFSPLLTVLVLLVVPAMALGMRWITRRTGKLFKDQQRDLGDLNGYVEETLSGGKIVRVFSMEEKVMAEFREKNARLRHSAFWAQVISGYIPKLMNGLNNLNFAVIAGIGGWLAVRDVISVGTIVIFAEYARQFTRPLNDLANQFNTVLSAVAGAERVFEIIDEQAEEDHPEAVELKRVRGEVCFSRVSFSYEEEEGVLHEVSFRASPGQTVALVGPTGAGKTTIINLLSRFYDPDDGLITIDGHDITAIRRESLRSHMAFVLQDPFLFRGTIRENIRYGRLEASDQEVEEAAKAANAHPFIVNMPDGYDTMLDHEGGGISQGQKQLISIARAMLARPSILVLDEATSSIDTVTEIHIQEALRRLMEGRTSFVIAHRLNTVREADLIVVIQDGTVAEQGTHEQLLRQDGFYAELYKNYMRKRESTHLELK